MLVAALGVLSGLITTLSGFGGGIVLVASLALVWSPLTALTVTSIALLVGNAQRLFLFRKNIVWRYALPPALGVMPGALVGSFVATSVSDTVLRIAIVVATVLALAKLLLGDRMRVAPYLVMPFSAGIGFIAATSGGGSFLLAPLLLSSGAQGGSYIAAASATGVSIHLFRIAGYTSTGLLQFELVLQALLLSLAIVAGNLIGRRVRAHLPPVTITCCEYGAPAVGAALAGFGLI